MNISVWLQAFRLRTLPLALSCILMGSFLAVAAQVFRWDIFVLCITTTIFLQILSNLANDYGDTIHGADRADRVGPSRMVQSGAINPKQMKLAVIVFVGLCLASGLLLLRVAFGFDWQAFLFFLALGILCILAAVAYTVGRRPYGYMGLGDFSVLLFFGVVGVMGSYYLFAKQIVLVQLLPAFSCGFFSMGVLNINNIRDIESDRAAGKFSIPVRVGRKKAIAYHWFLILAGLVCAVAYMVLTFTSAWQLLFFISIPFFIYNGLAVSKKPSTQLDPYLKQMALSTLLFVVLFGLGLILSR